MPDAHRAQAHVKIGKADPKKAEPCPQHVTAIKTAHACVRAIACRRLGKLVQKTASQMPQRMTTERVPTKQNNIDCENDCTDANSKSIRKPERLPNIVG